MSTARLFTAAVVAITALLPSASQSQTLFVPSPAYDRWWQVAHGTSPLDSAGNEGTDIQRVSAEVYLLNWPTVELRRDAAGKIALSLFFLGNLKVVPAASADWEKLQSLASNALTPASDRDLRSASRRLRRVACHGALALIETKIGESRRRLTAWSCLGRIAQPALNYANALAEIALLNIAECKPLAGSSDAIQKLLDCTTALGWKVTPAYAAAEKANPFPHD